MKPLKKSAWGFSLVLTLLCAGSNKTYAAATTYYVNSNATGGHGDNGPGTSQEDPWRSLSKPDNYSFKPGDTLLFAKGSSYNGGIIISASGTPSSRITFSSYGSGPAPRFTNSNWSPFNGNVFQLKGDFITVENMYFYNGANPPFAAKYKNATSIWLAGAIFITVGSDHNIIRSNEITNFPIGIRIQGQNTLVTNNYIHDNNRPVQRNWGPIGITIDNSNNEVSYNTITNYKAPSIEYPPFDGGAIEVDDNRRPKVNLHIHHNKTSDNAGFLELIGTNIIQDNIVISYNVSDDFQDFILFANAVTNMDIFHNTVIRRKHYNGIDEVLTGGGTGNAHIRIFNNIFYFDGNLSMFDRINYPHDHNLYVRYTSTGMISEKNATMGIHPVDGQVSPGTGDIVGKSALFVDFANENYHLQGGSPAINAGTDSGTKYLYENVLPSRDAPDMGAYEYLDFGSGPLVTIGSTLTDMGK
jgi:hypothetical protein